MYNEVFHKPPPAEQLEERMAAMCDFANGETPGEFLHPVLRSIVLHFWLAYDHPFLDGNGRVARALFYWSMLRHQYWLFEFISISQIILTAPIKYARAFLYTETDENDLTYFIIQQLDVIRRAMQELHSYIERKTTALRAVENRLRGITVLNHRQQALIGHALRHPHQRYTFRAHQMSHHVVYQTARTDLLDLEGRGLLTGRKIGKTWHFTPAKDLEDRLSRLS
jgi:Fic family protein